ncbi:mitochondrial carrier [Marasmius fiardii PR-910]|nr:mitochondrial carrier [Marasmius fiardii PR-910]
MRSDGDASHTSNDDSASGNSVVTLRAAVQDIAFGSLAGMVSEIFEYPFDLAKVRLQSQLLSGQPTFKGPMDCLVKTWQEEGVRGLYRGLTVPLVGSMAETAAIFLAYNSFQNAIHRYYGTASVGSNGHREPLSIMQLGAAAAAAGTVGSFIITPIELVKCKLQVQMMSTHTPSRITPLQTMEPPLRSTPPPKLTSTPGPISITRTIIQNNGFRGLWLGHTGTVLRDTGGTAVWFATKEWVGRLLRQRRRDHTSPGSDLDRVSHPQTIPLLPWESAVAGAVAGAICTVALYPADTVKSAVQTEEELREYRNRFRTSSMVRMRLSSLIPKSSFVQTFVKIYSSHGLQGLYSGCGMTMARAIPSSGIVFVVYDGLMAWFG